jgi:glycine dehydrogenase subunit 2
MIAKDVKAGETDKFHQYPVSSPRRRLNEVTAARQPRLRWKN